MRLMFRGFVLPHARRFLGEYLSGNVRYCVNKRTAARILHHFRTGSSDDNAK